MDTVIKVGGSLASLGTLKALGEVIFCGAKQRCFVIVPGGGEFADAVRKLDAEIGLSAMIAHRMAILAMDQYGLLLSQVFFNTAAVNSFRSIRSTQRQDKIPVFLPSKALSRADPFLPSWDVTSDSIAAYTAFKLKAKKVVLVTDVDGIFTSDPKNCPDSQLLKTITPRELLRFNCKTSVDRFLPQFLLDKHLDCFVVNGRFPERVAAVLSDEEAVCTIIHQKE